MKKLIMALTLCTSAIFFFSFVSTNASASTGQDIAEKANWYVRAKGADQQDENKRVAYSQTSRNKNLFGDCSTFSRDLYAQFGITGIGDYTAAQLANPKGQYISTISGLQKGDLVFFKANRPNIGHVVYSNGSYVRVSHVAIYVGNGNIVDLSSYEGTIQKRSINHPTLSGRFLGGKRFVQ